MSEAKVCTACGRPYEKKSILPSIIVGGVIGFAVGISFVSYWFGMEAGFTHSMALIHEVAGTTLGLLGGLIVGVWRR